MVVDKRTKKQLFEPKDHSLDKEELTTMFNSILLDFMGGDDKFKGYIHESKRVVKAATLIKDRVNHAALKNLITKTFSVWEREMYAGDAWEQIEQILHLSEPMVMPKEYGELHLEL